MPDRETRKVEFVNARGSASALYWVDFDGVEVHYVDLPPGMTTVMSTFAHHVAVARDMATEGAIAMYTGGRPGARGNTPRSDSSSPTSTSPPKCSPSPNGG